MREIEIASFALSVAAFLITVFQITVGYRKGKGKHRK